MIAPIKIIPTSRILMEIRKNKRARPVENNLTGLTLYFFTAWFSAFCTASVNPLLL
ncbi:hypothetical protein CLCOS_15240 [Clostridium coskatii]|uniref:Uncharacterized protein n=1 Tax=Clostridium coskatii TaxID=1705578 RepID=A0ABX2WVT4_9CLOT|nr:Hypothetical protein CLAU_0491 [Clostridium autoethanogenum DSM 10061]OBR95200.1 hypothetical protein CLCOS_15240 [Clostridium coskatii]